MRRWYAIPPLVAAAAAVAVALPTSKKPVARAAQSNSGQLSILQDDQQLLYMGPQRQTKTMKELKALGVNVVKVAVVWWLIAPQANSAQEPSNFSATDPAAYSLGAWVRYDMLVR